MDVIMDYPLPNDYLNDWSNNPEDEHMMDQPTTDPPPVPDNTNSMTLRQFCRRAKDLLNLDETDFVRFVLTGKDIDGSQSCIDPILNRVTREDPLDFIRDYDSLLGFSSQVRIKKSLTVYPVPKNEDTLSHTIHIRHKFRTVNVGFTVIIFNLS
jgi:hypothetical protein